MASTSCYVSANPPKRRRYCLSLKRPAIIHQNLQVVPPLRPGYDEEGKLPESLPPTPVIDLVTEDEATDIERTPQHQEDLRQPKIEQPSVEDLNPDDIENEDLLMAPPPLQPLRKRGGKTMAAMLASIRETSPASSTASRSPPASPPASPTPSQLSQGGDEDMFLYVETAQQHLQRTKTRFERLAPKIHQRLEASSGRVAEIRLQMAALQARLEEEAVLQQQCEVALLTIQRFAAL